MYSLKDSIKEFLKDYPLEKNRLRNAPKDAQQKSVAKMICPLCSRTITEGIPLSNGTFVHEQCLNDRLTSRAQLEGAITESKRVIHKYRTALKKQATFLSGLFSFFLGKHIHSDLAKEAIQNANNDLCRFQVSYDKISKELESIYDYFLEYPPDWEMRKKLVTDRDQHCQNCRRQRGYRTKLHVHHIIPLGKGGSNRLDNLILLCEKCHKQIHRKQYHSNLSAEESRAFTDRIITIQQALVVGQKVVFQYKKLTDTVYKERIVKPYSLVTIPHQDGKDFTLCLHGFCYLRNDKRTFALKRMKGLKIANTD